MSKTLLHRLFGFGKIPRRYAPTLREEGIVLLDEGLGGTITLRKFRAPGRRHSFERSWFTGCVVLTEKTFAAFSFLQPVVFVPLSHERFGELSVTVEDAKTLCVAFDAGAFHEGWSGSVECRFHTPQARFFLERLGNR